MSDLRQRLARLGLSQYLEVFTVEGFDTWETVLDVTESDLSYLQVKLGHRRKLQKAIAESRGQDRVSPIALPRAPSVEGSYRSGDESGIEIKRKQGESSAAGAAGTATKRKYRRHPRPDEHAPERPPSAYVIFSNQVRELLKGQDLSFTEIAKVVGERWQVLPTPSREACERQANSAKEKYYTELADYKKTPQYESYQEYLEEFKAKHAVPTKEGKRYKLGTETSTSIRSSSHDQHERSGARRFSGQFDTNVPGHPRSEYSPPVTSGRPCSGPGLHSKTTSPSVSGLNSPHNSNYFPGVAASPRSTNQSKESSFELSGSNLVQDPRLPAEAVLPYPISTFSHPSIPPSSITSLKHPSAPQYHSTIDLSTRRPMREVSAQLPPLTHEDTTWSSESSHSGYNLPPGYTGCTLPLDPSKTMRVLPQPISTFGPSASPLDRPSQLPMSQIPPAHDYRTQGPLAALVRAGELASRIADDEQMEVEGSP